jgi:P4 family phage/plasmid primase-like protien
MNTIHEHTDAKKLLHHLTSLADEGETLLLVTQKPILQDGKMQFHADGAIKAAWHAFLPTHKVKTGAATYVNTGVFIQDRFRDGRPSASAANCEHVAFMMLDDIGTKSKVPPLPPTWKIETSPGNQQWGYVFSEQPTKGEFTAAITAIAAAGYTDTGATNAVRNCRLPGSINLKPGKNGFAARLTELHPEREFTLPEICEALGVVPGPADGRGVEGIKIADNGGDSVLRWLSDHGLVRSQVNAEGWCGVVCPNSAEHTDGNPEGRYNPANRAFCCYHAHCERLDSNALLTWVAEQGGPKAEHGLREDLFSERLKVLKTLQATEAFPDPAEVDHHIRAKHDSGLGGDIANGLAFAALWRGRLLHVPEDNSILEFNPASGWLKVQGEKARLNAAGAVVRGLLRDASRASDGALREALTKRALRSDTTSRLNAMAEFGFAQEGLWASLAEFDSAPGLLGVQNGVLHLDDRRLLPPSPDMLVSKRANVAYDPGAQCPTFERFLAEVQPEDGSRRLLKQLAGICLFGKPLVQHLFFMHGSGANGKSTFMEVLAWLLGDYAAAIGTETLMSNKRDPQSASPDLMRLKGARLAFCNETGEGRQLDSNAVKQMTGFDTLTARPLYGAPVQFAPSHKLVMTGNHRPIVRETGEALWRRLLLIGWPVTIPAEGRDAALAERLRAEGAGILNWALDGLSDFRSFGSLAIPDEARKATAEYRSEQDIVGEWISERLVSQSNSKVEATTAYFDYRDWCQDNGHHAMSKNSLTRKLEERGIKRGGDGRRYYLDIHLVDHGSAAQFAGLRRAVGL